MIIQKITTGNTIFFFYYGMHKSWPHDTTIYGTGLSKIMLRPPSFSNITSDFKEAQLECLVGAVSTKDN